jgi:hypothetical protein
MKWALLATGHVVEWHRPRVQRKFNLEAGEAEAFVQGRRLIVGIEVLPPGAPTDAEVPAPAATAPTASPALRRPSDAAVEQCFRGIMDERPDDPPDEDWLLAEMKTRLGAPPGRQRVRNLWKGIAPQWKRPRGHPRNFNSAKKSAE